MKRQQGISLLEMLVALTILAISATVLFDWVYQVNARMRALNVNQTETMAQLQAVEFLAGINPASRPTGSQAFSAFTLLWEAKPATPMRKAMDANDGPLLFELAVYDVHAKLMLPASANTNDKPWLEFDTRLPGWTKLRGNMAAGMGVP